MKVRHQQSQIQREVETVCGEWYILKPIRPGLMHDAIRCEPSGWQIVPDERWEDVTSQCQIDDTGVIYHNNTCAQGPYRSGAYRARKVRVLHAGDAKDAILIERKAAHG